MRISSFVLFGVAVLMGLAAAMLAVNWMERQRGAPAAVVVAPQTTVRKVVVASQPLRFGMELTSVNLKEVEWPAGAIPAGAFVSTADLIKAGERRVVISAIERDEPVLAGKITGPGARASLSAVIDNGKTAATIRVNDVSGTAGFVLPGDRVDVLMTRTEDEGGSNTVLLQNIQALAIDQLADNRAEKPFVVKAVTLEVTQEEAQRLALAQSVGQLSLALRKQGETKVTDPPRRIDMSDLGDPAPQAVPAPAAIQTGATTPPPPAVSNTQPVIRVARHDCGNANVAVNRLYERKPREQGQTERSEYSVKHVCRR